MIQKLNAGAEHFRVQMNTSKTILSFKSTIPKFKFLKQLRKKKRLPWCGYAFNTKTLTVRTYACPLVAYNVFHG